MKVRVESSDVVAVYWLLKIIFCKKKVRLIIGPFPVFIIQ